MASGFRYFCCSSFVIAIPQGSVWRRAFDGSATLLALVVAGAWLSNAPLGVMACYLLAAVAFTVALLQRSWAPCFDPHRCRSRASDSAPSTSFPPLWSSAGYRSARPPTIPGSRLKAACLFGHHADPNLELHDVELWRVSAIAVLMIGLTFLCFFICVAPRTAPSTHLVDSARPHPRSQCLLLQFPFSLPLWTSCPSCAFCSSPGAGSS